jgi:hypothetical protein
MHLSRSSLEELSTSYNCFSVVPAWQQLLEMNTADEQSVASEDNLLVAILHEPADTILGVAGRVKTGHGDVANHEGLLMSGSPSDTLTVFSTYNREIGNLEVRLLLIAQGQHLSHESEINLPGFLTSFLFPPA